MSDEDTDPEATESDEKAAEAAESDPAEATAEASEEPADDGDQPAISDDEQAVVPDDIDPDDVEEEAGADESPAAEEGDTADESEDTDTDTSDDADAMQPDSGGASVAKAGELYVSMVRSATNAQIRKHDGNELPRDHFEQYDLAEHFNDTMDYLGVGSDLEPHEALLFATVLSVGDGVTRETDIVDEQIDRLLDKAMGGDEVAA